MFSLKTPSSICLVSFLILKFRFYFFFKFSWFLKLVYIFFFLGWQNFNVKGKVCPNTSQKGFRKTVLFRAYLARTSCTRSPQLRGARLAHTYMWKIWWMNLSLLRRQSTLLLGGSSTDDGWDSLELRCSTHYWRRNFPFYTIVRES